jgi:hypothetical protein
MRGTRRLGGACAAGLAVILVGCTGMLPQPDIQAERPSPSTSSTPIPTSEPTPDVEPPVVTGPCAGAVPAYPLRDTTEVEQLGGASLAVPLDRGSMPHAIGDAILNDQGVPVAYTVAADDVLSTVGARFCVGEIWLRWVNYVRRDGDALFVGDTLNLDAHTIFSVGDQNGVVHDNALPDGFAIPRSASPSVSRRLHRLPSARQCRCQTS